MKTDWDQVYIRNFSTKLLNPREWISTADELTGAAEVLAPQAMAWWDNLKEWSNGRRSFPKNGYHSTVLMLYAFAIENLCKGYLVNQLSSEEKESIRTSGKLPREFKIHDLKKLVERIGLKPDLEDEDMLKRLERASVWGGRYPIPMDYSKERATYSDGKQYSTALLGRTDLARTRTLTQRIRDHVDMP
jgi:hypothetical protein